MTIISHEQVGTQQQTSPLTLQFAPIVKVTNDQMYRLGQLNRGVRLERSAKGQLEIGTLHNEEDNWRNSKIFLLMVNWAMNDRTGLVFEAGTSFVLPDGAMRYPDLAWVRKSRLVKVAIKKNHVKYLPLCPDFVLQLMGENDSLEAQQDKMRAYLANGAQLAWLLDPREQLVYVFTPGEPDLCLTQPSSISGEPLLRGFSLHPDHIWKTDF